MKVAVVQSEPRFGRVRENLDGALETLSSVDADLFVFPELALSGYLFESAAEARELAQEPQAPEFDALAEAARSRGASVVIGFAERSGDDLFNSSMLLAADGRMEVYRKIHLFDSEKEIFLPGNEPAKVVEVGGVWIGMMICFDWIFPELARSLALDGADILCHSANLVLPYCQDAMITRCLENRVFAATANRVGTEARAGVELTFTGRSEIVAPDGQVLVRASDGMQEVLVADIDPAAAREKWVTPKNHVHEDRRPELYHLD